MDLELLWLWRRPEAAVPVCPLAWESPYAAGTAPKDKKKKKLSITFKNYELLYLYFNFLKNTERKKELTSRNICLLGLSS